MLRKYIENKSTRLIVEIILGLAIYFVLVSLLVYFERDSQQSAITTYENAIWYSIVTLSTVGYGDLFPATVYGRFIGYIFMIMSLGVIGLLIGQVTNLLSTYKENKRLGYNGTDMKDHAVIIGWNSFGRMVLEQLVGVGKKVAIITKEKDDIDFIREADKSQNVYVLYADFNNFELIRKANIEESSIVFINLDNDTEKLVYILNIKKHFPNLEFVVTLDNGDLKNTFISVGVTNTISKHEISSKLLASYMFEPDVAAFAEAITSYAKSESDYDLKQFLINSSNPYVGKSYQDTFFELKKRYNAVLIGITKRDKFGVKKLIKNPYGDLKISAGDYIIILVNGKGHQLLSKVFNVHEGLIRDQEKHEN